MTTTAEFVKNAVETNAYTDYMCITPGIPEEVQQEVQAFANNVNKMIIAEFRPDIEHVCKWSSLRSALMDAVDQILGVDGQCTIRDVAVVCANIYLDWDNRLKIATDFVMSKVNEYHATKVPHKSTEGILYEMFLNRHIDHTSERPFNIVRAIMKSGHSMEVAEAIGEEVARYANRVCEGETDIVKAFSTNGDLPEHQMRELLAEVFSVWSCRPVTPHTVRTLISYIQDRQQ